MAYLRLDGQGDRFCPDQPALLQRWSCGSSTRGQVAIALLLDRLGDLPAETAIKEKKTKFSSVAKAFQKFDADRRFKPTSYYDRVVDVCEKLAKFTLLTRDLT
jgi:hypothetical protein